MPDTPRGSAAHRHLPPPEEVVAAVLPTFMLQPSGPRGEPHPWYMETATAAVAALRDAGYRLMQSVCEACDDC